MSEINQEGRALLAAARATRPSAAARARIDAGLTLQLLAVPILMASAPRAAVTAPTASASMTGAVAAGAAGAAKALVLKAILIATLSGGLGAGGAALWTARSRLHSAQVVPAAVSSAASSALPVAAMETPPAPGAAPEPDSVAAPVAAVTTPQASQPAARSRVPAVHAPSAGAVAPAAPAATSLDQELSLLRDAQRALKKGDGTEALARLDALGERYPDGVLREERLAARVLGLCAAGRRDEARDAGRRFVADNPGSVQVSRVRASCAFAPRDDGNR